MALNLCQADSKAQQQIQLKIMYYRVESLTINVLKCTIFWDLFHFKISSTKV